MLYIEYRQRIIFSFSLATNQLHLMQYGTHSNRYSKKSSGPVSKNIERKSICKLPANQLFACHLRNQSVVPKNDLVITVYHTKSKERYAKTERWLLLLSRFLPACVTKRNFAGFCINYISQSLS